MADEDDSEDYSEEGSYYDDEEPPSESVDDDDDDDANAAGGQWGFGDDDDDTTSQKEENNFNWNNGGGGDYDQEAEDSEEEEKPNFQVDDDDASSYQDEEKQGHHQPPQQQQDESEYDDHDQDNSEDYDDDDGEPPSKSNSKQDDFFGGGASGFPSNEDWGDSDPFGGGAGQDNDNDADETQDQDPSNRSQPPEDYSDQDEISNRYEDDEDEDPKKYGYDDDDAQDDYDDSRNDDEEDPEKYGYDKDGPSASEEPSESTEQNHTTQQKDDAFGFSQDGAAAGFENGFGSSDPFGSEPAFSSSNGFADDDGAEFGFSDTNNNNNKTQPLKAPSVSESNDDEDEDEPEESESPGDFQFDSNHSNRQDDPSEVDDDDDDDNDDSRRREGDEPDYLAPADNEEYPDSDPESYFDDTVEHATGDVASTLAPDEEESEQDEDMSNSLNYLNQMSGADPHQEPTNEEDSTIESSVVSSSVRQNRMAGEEDDELESRKDNELQSPVMSTTSKSVAAELEASAGGGGKKKAYTREQMRKLAKASRNKSTEQEDESEHTEHTSRSKKKSKDKKKTSKKDKKGKSKKNGDSSSVTPSSDGGRSKSKKKKSKGKKKASVKSKALLDLVTNVNEAMQAVEAVEEKLGDNAQESDCRSLLNGFEALVGILLQLSDELELMSTFNRAKDHAAIEALDALLSFAPVLDEAFTQLDPVLRHYLTSPVDEELGDLFYGMNLMVDLLCELAHRVGERQEWNPRACTSFTSLLELLARDSLEVVSIFDDVDTPAFEVSPDLAEAWNATGHTEEYTTLTETEDLALFRQICYQVILSCDQWCPDVDTLMDICGIDETMLEEGNAAVPLVDDSELPPGPESALQVLEKINGLPVPRRRTLAHILKRVLPGGKITDPRLIDSLVSIRNTIRPVGVPAVNMVAISSVPESGSKQGNSLGVAGVGKSTLAAIVANHMDVRRHFSDGIAWVHIGQKELNYTRYVQCLKDVLSQLDIQDAEEPLFPELLQTPGEPITRARRREEGFMMFVRESVADFLQDRKVLIVLDDVCFDSDLDWFDFGAPPEEAEDQSAYCFVLVTTRRRDLLPPADTVEVDVLEEGEAVQLLIQESGDLSKNLAESAETRAVVRECAYHPLAVKSVGRWLNLKHATAGSKGSKEEIHEDVVSSMEKILRSGASDEADMMYEILNMSLSPAINGEPTTIIKFCFAAFVRVFCDKEFISDFALADASPIVPLMTAELLFEALLNLEEENLRKEGSLFHANKKDAAILIPEALSALGVLKVIETVPEEEEEEDFPEDSPGVEKYLQITHIVQQEYAEYLLEDDISLKDFTVDAERRWNRSFAQTFLDNSVEWDSEAPDAGLDYALEMMPVHMIRGGMYPEASKLLANEKFIRGRLFALGRENGARRHIKDCETLFDVMTKRKGSSRKKFDGKGMLKNAYEVLGSLLNMDEDEFIKDEGSPEAVEVGRCHFEIGFSLAEKRCWEAAIKQWETSQELFVSSLGMVEVVAGVLFNVGFVYSQMTEYEQALGSLKQCLRIRGAIHGEEHILYAQTIQKIGDVFLAMSDYHEAMESYNWALDVMHIEPSHHRIDIGDILENMGNIHYSKGEIDESLQCFQDSLRSKVADLGQDHPELASIYQHIGDCLSDQGKADDAIVHFNEAIRLKELDPYGSDERDADVLTIKGMLHNLKGKQQQGLECYEKSLQILVTRVPHRKEKVASLLHLIGCVYLVSGEHKKAMKLFEESLNARRKVLGFVHLDVASTLFNMAFLHQTRNRLDKALKCLEEALKIRQLRLPDSEKVALTHEKIGTLARSIGKAKKAENAFIEALRIRKLIHGEGHVAVATVMQELGDLFDDLGDYNEASKYYREALKIRHNRLGPEDLAVAETFYSMGFTLLNQGALDKALECLEESLSIRKFKLGEDAKECGDTLNTMGFIQAKRQDLDDALELLWEALRIRKLQGDKIKISETLKNIGNVHREKQEFELAKECYEECLRVRREELGEAEDDRVADALIAIGNVYSDMNQPAQAMESYQEALAIRSRLFGDSDESVAAVLQYMGTLEFKAKRLDRAFQLLNEFINIRSGNDTEPDGDYVNVLFMIGNIHKMQGNEGEAQVCWTQAYKIFKELGLAHTNPQIAEVMEKLMKDNTGMAEATDAADEADENGDIGDPMSSSKKKGVFNRLKKKGTGRSSGKREKGRGQRL